MSTTSIDFGRIELCNAHRSLVPISFITRNIFVINRIFTLLYTVCTGNRTLSAYSTVHYIQIVIAFNLKNTMGNNQITII